MADSWTTIKAGEVQPGDVVRYREVEFEVARIDDPFLGLDTMICLIEDNPDRWHAYPAGKDGELEVRRAQ